MGPRQLQCFGGPACGQWVTCQLQPDHIQVVGKLLRFDLRSERYGPQTMHQATYQPQLLQIGQGPLFSSRLILRHVPPGTGEDDEDA